MSSTPVAASAPAAKRSESPGRNGQMTRPVSMKMIANNIAYTQMPYCATNSARWTSRCRNRSMTYSMRRDGLLSDCAERDIQNGVLAPVLVIVMPPFVRLDGKPLRLHHFPQQIAAGALLGGAAGVVRIGTLG